MEIIFTDGKDERFVALCNELDEYLCSIVGGEKQRKQYSQYNSLDNIHDVALAIENGRAAACGSFKEYEPGTAEIKRVFTKEDFRNRGYSKTIIQALETRALNKGYTRLILETGLLLREAQRMYTQMGFHTIPNYGQYINMSESICMEKILA
jgi:GNAT superfamily N-acetyltransferase